MGSLITGTIYDASFSIDTLKDSGFVQCTMQVHSTLENGFQEVIYQRTLAIEMKLESLSFIREMEMPVFYRDIQIGTRRVDFSVEEKIMVELKVINSSCYLQGLCIK